MIFLAILFFVNIIVGIYRDMMLSKFIKANNLTIKKTSWSMGYKTKELSQLYSQSTSKKTDKMIRKIININNISDWLWIGWFISFFLFILLGIFGIDLFQFD